MNFKNLAENLIIVIVAAFVGGTIGYYASTNANKQTVELLRPTIEEAIRKETNQISNTFKTEIKKLKTKNGQSQIEIKPVLENEIDQDTIVEDSLSLATPEKKKGFFNRLFGKKDK